jgi:hypothetical protein
MTPISKERPSIFMQTASLLKSLPAFVPDKSKTAKVSQRNSDNVFEGG